MVAIHGRYVRTLALFFLAVFGLPALSAAQAGAVDRAASKLDRLLSVRARQLTGRSRVIVEFFGSPDVRAITAAHGVATRTMRGRPAHVADISNLDLSTLAKDPRVARVMADRPAFAMLERTGTAIGLRATNPGEPEPPETGYGIGIAVIDSGVNTSHDDLWHSSAGQRVVAFMDFTVAQSSNWSNVPPRDGFGHGTHVAGILAGNGYDSSGRRKGIARRADLIALKALDDDGLGFISSVIEAIDYAIANRTALGIRVINLSVGAGVYESYHTDPLAQATKRAVDAGIVVVASAGNLGQNAAHESQLGGITSPGNAPWVLTVGASSHQGTVARGDDTVAAFSSRGPTWLDFSAKPDLVAPGVGIESLADPHSVLYSELQNYLLDGTRALPYKPYLSLTGTSMAAPVVAGTVALMLEANPSLTPNAVKAILQYTAEARPGDSPLVSGAGFVNARGALRLARFFASPQNGLGAPVDTIASQSITWARHLIWGNYRVTGGVPLPGSNAWATSVAWGDMRTPGGSLVVWGAATPDNVVWGESANGNVVWGELTGDNVVWGESGSDNVVWGEADGDNVVWGEADADNVVWGEACGGANCDNVVWGENTTDNVVWGEADGDNVVWGEGNGDNVVWGEGLGDNVVWGEALRSRQVLWPR
ncbi:MAG TPA: S8 family peptidase [Vicinamibacterales bacterium]|jgi:serine protease AprX|nr:S8 family peptidase [Vicinamibacterales bacterium]